MRREEKRCRSVSYSFPEESVLRVVHLSLFFGHCGLSSLYCQPPIFISPTVPAAHNSFFSLSQPYFSSRKTHIYRDFCLLYSLVDFFCFHLVLSCLVLSCLVLSCLVLSCLLLSSLVLSCCVLSCVVWSGLVLSCLVFHPPLP